MDPVGTNTGKEGGFTLIEIIASLILIGVLAVMAGSALVSTVQAYLLARESTALSQKAQLALTRVNKELILCYDCGSELDLNDPPYSFTNPLGDREITLEDGELKLNDDTLVDQVSTFELSRPDPDRRTIEVTLELNHRQAKTNLTFQTRVFPRNIYYD
ncbi:MAG: type II secretion system protein [Desulfurivibrionaceae bacterium]